MLHTTGGTSSSTTVAPATVTYPTALTTTSSEGGNVSDCGPTTPPCSTRASESDLPQNKQLPPYSAVVNSKRSAPADSAVPFVKKRPYRRTKRPKDYNVRSTITTVTTAAANDAFLRSNDNNGTSNNNTSSESSPLSSSSSSFIMNAYDAILAESQDLMQAAAQAQQLGRLKMASAYLLLLHARLVGLGKLFDKIRPLPPVMTMTNMTLMWILPMQQQTQVTPLLRVLSPLLPLIRRESISCSSNSNGRRNAQNTSGASIGCNVTTKH